MESSPTDGDLRERIVADLERVIDALPQGVTVQSPSGEIVLANAAAARILGLESAAEVIALGGDGLRQRIAVLDDPRDTADTPPDAEPAIVRWCRVGTGEERFSRVSRRVLDDGSGRARWTIHTFEDVTDAQRAVLDLQHEQARLATVIGSLEDAAIAIDARSRAVGANRVTDVRDARDERRAHQRAEQRARLLAEAGAVLASSLEYESTLQSVARLLVPHVADWCEIDLLERDGSLTAVEIAHADPEKVRWAWELRALRPHDPTSPIGPHAVARTGRPLLVPDVPDDALVAFAKDEADLALLRTLGLSSWMSVPLVARGHTIGVLTLVATESRARFGPADLSFAQELAARAASAIENARRHREALAALTALQRLEAITSAALAGAGVDDTLREVLASLCSALGSDLGVILLLADGGSALELRATHGFVVPARSPGRIARAERVWSWTVLASDTARIAARVEDVAAFRDVREAQGVARVLSCPLRGAHGPIGVMHLAARRADAFSSHELLLAQVAGERIAAVVDRLSLLESERRARAEAERANRLKDDFLAIVSHELRTPLNAVVGWVQILQKRQHEADLVARGLERIARNGDALVRIVGDLIDVAQIMRGRLTLQRERVAIAGVLHAAADTVGPAAAAGGVTIEVDVSARAGEVIGDPQRLQQAVWNLLSNAVKFTPRDGRVVVRARRRAGWITIEVEDTGRGIAPDFLPHVFERFRQEDQGSTREHGGLGLGLAIVRHIVEQHGGEVLARSEGIGQGATFAIRLPVAPARD